MVVFQIAVQGREDLRLAPDDHAGFVMTLLRMVAFRPEGGEMPLASIPAGRKTVAAAAQAAAPSRRATQAEQTPAAAGDGRGRWAELAERLQLTGAARELVRHAELRGERDGVFDFVVPKSMAHLAAYQDKLKAALEQQLDRRVTVKISAGEAGGDSLAARETSEREARRAQAVQSVQGDRFVQDLVSLFDAKVVDTTVQATPKNS